MHFRAFWSTTRSPCFFRCDLPAAECAADAAACSTWLAEYDCTNPVKMHACPESCPAARRMAAAGKPASLGHLGAWTVPRENVYLA